MIREKRLAQNIKLREMASALSIGRTTLSRYETGKREWPSKVLSAALQYLGAADVAADEPHWSWRRHRDWWDSYEVACDSGQTWADFEPGYREFYRRLKPTRMPSLEFRRKVRMDSALEACAYVSLCEAGAECIYASLALMNFPFHHLTTETRAPLPINRRAALFWENWLLWPQVNLLVGSLKFRLDALAFNGHKWVAIEFDGPVHTATPDQARWEAKREGSLAIPTVRFHQAEILSGHFAQIFLKRILEIPGTK